MTKKSSKPTPHKGLKVLFADDEDSLQEVMKLELPRMGHTVTVCPDGETALAALEKNNYDCLLVDIDMPGISGIDVMSKAAEMSPETVAIVLTGKSSVDSAVAALRFGAFDYLTKPCRLFELKSLLQKVAENRKLRRQYLAVKHQLMKLEGQTRLVGNSDAMGSVRKMITRVAPTPSTVMIHGETGTGKELVARAFHDQSHRSDMPFVAINCGALPESLIESELFGHRRGAFTGADENRVGLFEVANGGTVFLDEIGELPKTMQAKLLRVLECGEIRRVGDNESFVVDVRVVCATNRDLSQMVEDGEFREDLMFRINTFEIEVPPLRSRISDIPLLADHLLRRFRPNVKESGRTFSERALEFLTAHVWPGNVRELANVIEHAAILCDQLPIEPEHFPQRFAKRQLRGPLRPISLREIEMQAIYASIERHDGNKQAAAAELGISLKTLYNRLNQASQLKVSA
ncbi:MAG TPA: sigma-54-dependent Fis family transcriptional regulator [Planctomycetaceae bacterium]|nr:sigma-54-dependent Fis family transcriptional regulator [Planctomycetaceae bacterium]